MVNANFFKNVLERVNIVDVARIYGLNLNNHNKCLCPFHKENTPSFSVSEQKQIFKCFGCDEGGNAISLVSKLLNINYLNAAKLINKDLGLGLVDNLPPEEAKIQYKLYMQEREEKNNFQKWEQNAFKIMNLTLNYVDDYQNYLYEKVKDKDALINNNTFKELVKLKSGTDFILIDFFKDENSKKMYYNHQDTNHDIQYIKLKYEQIRYLGSLYGFSINRELSKEVQNYLGEDNMKLLSKYIQKENDETMGIYMTYLNTLEKSITSFKSDQELENKINEAKEMVNVTNITDILTIDKEYEKFKIWVKENQNIKQKNKSNKEEM